MLELFHVTKRFMGTLLLNDIHVKIEQGTIYGISGPDAEGMRALLRTMAGISRPDLGKVLIDEEELYENEELKQRSFLMAENMFFRSHSAIRDSRNFYSGYEPNWNEDLFRRLLTVFGLTLDQRYYTLTQGKKTQLRFAIAFATGSDYLLVEEPYLGLTHSEREQIQTLMRSYVTDRGATIVAAASQIQEEDADACGYMIDRRLLNGVSEREFRETERKLREEGEDRELDRFFR